MQAIPLMSMHAPPGELGSCACTLSTLPTLSTPLPLLLQVIPYLSVYAVLPSSLLFLFAYSSASQHLSRAALFNSIIGVFCAFFLAFAFVLLPNHATLHPDLAVLSQARTQQGAASSNWRTTATCISKDWANASYVMKCSL